jgi:hypothetical protein
MTVSLHTIRVYMGCIKYKFDTKKTVKSSEKFKTLISFKRFDQYSETSENKYLVIIKLIINLFTYFYILTDSN